MSGFLERHMAVMPCSARFVRFLAVLMLVAGPCDGVGRTYGEHSQGQETRQRTWALGHSKVPPNQLANHDQHGPNRPEGTTAPIRNCLVSATARENLTRDGTRTVLTHLDEMCRWQAAGPIADRALWSITECSQKFSDARNADVRFAPKNVS